MKINKLDETSSSFYKHLQFQWNRGKGHRLRYLWNRVRWHIYPRLSKYGSYPDHVDLELSSSCNMVCPMCYTTTPAFKNLVPHRNLDYSLFQKIVDELSDHHVFSIRLSWRGEPTLHPHFMDCIRYAKNKGIKEVDSLSNALRLTPAMFEEMVDLGMDWLTISFDGTGETYEQIRKPAKYQDMVDKIREFSEIKKRKNSVKPVIRIQGVWSAIVEDPERYFDTFEPIVDEVSVNTLLDFLHTDENIEYVDDWVCPVPFQRLAIGSDGRAMMCINDDFGRVPVGDANVESIYDIWNSEGLTRVRNIHKQKLGTKTLDPCKDCYLPRKTVPVPYKVGHRTVLLNEVVGRSKVIGE